MQTGEADSSTAASSDAFRRGNKSPTTSGRHGSFAATCSFNLQSKSNSHSCYTGRRAFRSGRQSDTLSDMRKVDDVTIPSRKSVLESRHAVLIEHITTIKSVTCLDIAYLLVREESYSYMMKRIRSAIETGFWAVWFLMPFLLLAGKGERIGWVLLLGGIGASVANYRRKRKALSPTRINLWIAVVWMLFYILAIGSPISHSKPEAERIATNLYALGIACFPLFLFLFTHLMLRRAKGNTRS